MLDQKEILEAIGALNTAVQEARAATRDAHAAKKDLKQEWKHVRTDVEEIIKKEVARQVGLIAQDIYTTVQIQSENVVEQIAKVLRERLGIPPA